MFAPIGYTTLCKIVYENFHEFDWQRLDADRIFNFIFEEVDGRSVWLAKTLSKYELIEKTIFKEVIKAGVYMCSPTGQLMKLELPIINNQKYLHHEVNSGSKFFSDEHYYYAETNINPYRLDQIEKLASEGKDPWLETRDEYGFCSINLFYRRSDYTISTVVFNNLNLCSDYGVLDEYSSSKEVIQQFEGWSLCVTDESASKLTFVGLISAFKLTLISEALGYSESELEEMGQTSKSSLGRPRIREEAAQAFLKHFSLEDRPSWKEVVNTLWEKEGVRIHERTLQRGLKDMTPDKTE